MFTGLVTDIGRIISVAEHGDARIFEIETHYPLAVLKPGASIACAGACLTVVTAHEKGGKNIFRVDVSSETLSKTTLKTWRVGRNINLESSLKLGDEMGGHLVTGHVDGVAKILTKKIVGDYVAFTIKPPRELYKFIAQKGSVALDGTSLTVNVVSDDHFEIMLIPHTLSVTTWGQIDCGDEVNIEIDLIARYAERLMHAK